MEEVVDLVGKGEEVGEKELWSETEEFLALFPWEKKRKKNSFLTILPYQKKGGF